MNPIRILILEDNADRIAAFREAVSKLGDNPDLLIWHDAPTMLAEVEDYLEGAALISLDHDLNPMPGAVGDPGDGLEVAKYLASLPPACPVILHTSNVDRLWSMHNEFRFGGWQTERVGPIGDDWIPKFWLPKARELIDRWKVSEVKVPPRIRKPADHSARMDRAKLALLGLSVGDGFGECFFCPESVFHDRLEERRIPPTPWIITDDSIMAISVIEVLDRFGFIDRNHLAQGFARRYAADWHRGYGGTAHSILRGIGSGTPWRDAAGRAFDGMGSMGNGAAMRVAPLGAYFAFDSGSTIMEQAEHSAEVTHAHREGIAGGIAVAAATAWAASHCDLITSISGTSRDAFFDYVLELTPDGETKRLIFQAKRIPAEASPRFAAGVLGNGSRVTGPDTVPFCVWVASRHLNSYADALWTTVSVGGDIDTNCAIVGGIVVMAAGRNSIPGEWVCARESLPFGGHLYGM